jgi:hypothetical protein
MSQSVRGRWRVVLTRARPASGAEAWRSKSRRGFPKLPSPRPSSADSGRCGHGAGAAYSVQLRLAGLAAQVSTGTFFPGSPPPALVGSTRTINTDLSLTKERGNRRVEPTTDEQRVEGANDIPDANILIPVNESSGAGLAPVASSESVRAVNEAIAPKETNRYVQALLGARQWRNGAASTL